MPKYKFTIFAESMIKFINIGGAGIMLIINIATGTKAIITIGIGIGTITILVGQWALILPQITTSKATYQSGAGLKVLLQRWS